MDHFIFKLNSILQYIRIVFSYCLITMKSIWTRNMYKMSLYMPESMRNYLYCTDTIIESNGKKYEIDFIKLGDIDILEPMLIYFNYNQPHTIDDLKEFHPEWYNSCETIKIKYSLLYSDYTSIIEINMQAKKEVTQDRKLMFGEITFEENDSDDESW